MEIFFWINILSNNQDQLKVFRNEIKLIQKFKLIKIKIMDVVIWKRSILKGSFGHAGVM
jgi:hypothetical protein